MTRRLAATSLTFVAALSIVLAACASDAEVTLAGYERDPVPEVGSYSLPAVGHGDAEFAFRADADKLLLMYFGFTNCPDICPTTLFDTGIALAELGVAADRIDLAMATVDPGRDTAQNLSDYVDAFVDGGVALRTEDPVRLLEVATAFGASYSVETDDEGDVEVGHTAHLYVIDENGKLILTWPFGVTSQDMASDMRVLLERQP